MYDPCSKMFIQFLLCQAFADDEASIRLLQILLFLLLSTASLMFIPCAVKPSFTLSIHFFGCLPLLLVPSTCAYSATTGSLFPSILGTCPNHVSLLFLILSTIVTCCPSSFLVTLFRILSLLDLPSILRSQLISTTTILLSSSFLRHQHCSSVLAYMHIIAAKYFMYTDAYNDRWSSSVLLKLREAL